MHSVLVVDDSALMRRLLKSVLSGAGYEVITARNGAEAVERLLEGAPDVVTLDINMPLMDGLTALSLMMQAGPTPVIMVSSLTEKGAQATFEALALGAFDFVAKPGGTISMSIDEIEDQLLAKVAAAIESRSPPDTAARQSGRRPARRPPGQTTAGPAPRRTLPSDGRPRTARLGRASPTATDHCPGLVIVGVSTGGPRTLEDILPRLPASFPWPVVVAQHMPASFTDAFARRLDQLCPLAVREVSTTTPLLPGTISIARGGSDLVVVERLGRVVAQPRPEDPAHPWHPSVDVLAESALALLPAERLIGVQLTGMGYDGAAALARLRAGGGLTIAESEETAIVFGMPAELIALDGASRILPADQIAGQLVEWLSGR